MISQFFNKAPKSREHFMPTSEIVEYVKERIKQDFDSRKLSRELGAFGFHKAKKRWNGGENPVWGYYVKVVGMTSLEELKKGLKGKSYN